MQQGAVREAKVNTDIGFQVRQIDARDAEGDVAQVELAAQSQVSVTETAFFYCKVVEHQTEIRRLFGIVGGKMLAQTIEIEPVMLLFHVDLHARKQGLPHPKTVLRQIPQPDFGLKMIELHERGSTVVLKKRQIIDFQFT